MKKLLPALLITASVQAQWNANPSVNNPIGLGAYDQQDAKIATDSKGGAIIAWLDYRADATMLAGDIYAQRIDKDGMVKWTLNGLGICTDAADQVSPLVQEDGSGGAIIAWEDSRSGNKDIYAQRVDSMGNLLWTANGVAIAAKAGNQTNPRLASDGNGGALIIWEDDSAMISDYNLFIQHVSSTGTLAWGSSGYAVCKQSFSQINPRIVSDGAGGAVICWQDKRNGSDYDIYAQRINASGVPQWTANGVALCLLAGTQSNPKMVSDLFGGAIIAWQDKRTGIDLDVYAQYVNSSGIPQWITGGKLVCNASGSQSAIDMTTDAAISGAIITWKDSRNAHFDVYGQKVDFAGNMQWTANGVAIANAANDQINPNVIPDGAGGAIVVWQDSLAGNYDIRAQRLGTTGALLWTAGGVNVGTAALNQTGPKNVGDGSGGSIYTFQDKRSGDFDIYAFKTDANGVAVGLNELASGGKTAYAFPVPSAGAVTIALPGQAGGFALSVYDAVGRKLIGASVKSDRYVINQKLEAGVYYYRVTSPGKDYSGKFIIEN